MIRILSFLGIIAFAILIGLAIRSDPGYAIFAYGPWEVESPLWFVFLALFAISLGWRFICDVFARIVGWTDHLFVISTEQRARRANQQTMQALLAYQKQNWAHGERLFLQGAAYSEAPLLNYLYAAYSAGQQKAYMRAYEYLERAHRLKDSYDWLADLARAEMLYDQGEYRESLAVAQNLRPKAALSVRLLKLLHRLYEHFEHHDDLLHLLNDLVSLNILNDKLILMILLL
ncbi:MAG: heme biosynthesis HemY N-terminal domain-containing protein [Pseudomonadota bacterium]